MKKQLKPRGRPWPKGVSGNPTGRPPGSRHKITLAVLEGARRAEEESSKPLMLDESRHYEVWSDCYVQDGMRFKRTTFERVNPEGPARFTLSGWTLAELGRKWCGEGRCVGANVVGYST